MHAWMIEWGETNLPKLQYTMNVNKYKFLIYKKKLE